MAKTRPLCQPIPSRRDPDVVTTHECLFCARVSPKSWVEKAAGGDGITILDVDYSLESVPRKNHCKATDLIHYTQLLDIPLALAPA